LIKSIEFTNDTVEELRTSFANYVKANDEKIKQIEMKLAEHSKSIGSLQTAEKSRDSRDRAHNLVVYGIPEVNTKGMNPMQWFEATRKQIQKSMGIDLPTNSVDDFLHMGAKKLTSDKRDSNPHPIKIYFATALDKSTFYHSFLTKREELARRGIRMRNDFNLETRKFRSAVNIPRMKLFKLGFRVRFIGAGDSLFVSSDERGIRGSFNTLEALMDFIKTHDIDLNAVVVNDY
jgi:hypothetical protein